MKTIIHVICALLLSANIFAQPGDAQIKKDVGGTGAHVKSFKFTKTTGTRQWNSSVGNWEYVRGVLVVRSSPDYPEYDLEVRGDAVYQDMGGGKYSYRRFRVISNRYLGIPDPSIDEIETSLAQDWKKFYRTLYQRIYKIHEPLRFTEEEYFYWYNPNSVEVTLKNKVEYIASDVETKVADVVYKVRLYRKDPKAAWDNFVGGQEDSHEEYKEYSSQKIDYQKAERLRKQSLAYTINESAAAAKQATYKSDGNNWSGIQSMNDLATKVHDIMQQGNDEQLEAALSQLLARHLMVDGSNVQVNDRGKQMIQDAIDAAFKKDGTYAMQYCTTPNFDQKRSNEKHIYIIGGMDNVVTQISGIEEKGAYVNGVAQTTWKITNINVGTRQDDDALAYFASFTDKGKMCSNTTTATTTQTNTNVAKPGSQAVQDEAKKQKEQIKGKLKKFINN